ncbi:MAG: phosphatase PAP2 family protein [Chloroflexi bacterium]|nr:phosphatase PAP2 family protein [Chloroflexota bacterium]
MTASLALVAALLAAAAPYPALNHGPAVLALRTALDDVVPLVPAAVVPYLSFFVFFIGSAVVFLVRRRATFLAGAVATLVTLGASYTIYAVAQSYIAPPALTGNGPFEKVLGLVFAVDPRYNAFPSLHAAVSTVWAGQWLRSRVRGSRLMVGWAALIVASTVLTKQHYVADAAAGVLLGLGASRLAAALVHEWDRARWCPQPDSNR